MNRQEAIKLLSMYGEAWVKRDPELILTIFTPDATYDDPKEPVNFNHDGIRTYWIEKVVNGQKDISFELLNTWVDGNTVIAEWHALFTDTKRNMRIDMNEIAVFGTRGGKFSSLREYYKTTKAPL